MPPSFAETLLAECFSAQGLDRAKAEKAAACALQVLPAAGLIKHEALEAFERDAHIYKLRGMRITAVAISERLGISRAGVFRAIRSHTQRRRAALRMVA